MTGGEFSLLLKSKLASSFYNIDSKRTRNATLHERKEGWTEIWGNLEEEEKDEEKKKGEGCWAIEDEAVKRLKGAHSPIPSIPLTLTQYRIAWYEQLALRICHIPHVVLNSSYSSMESTGPLPYIMDLPISSSTSASTEGKNNVDLPALVGRKHPGAGDDDSFLDDNNEEEKDTKKESSLLFSNSHIIDYLYHSSSYSHLLSKYLCLTTSSGNTSSDDNKEDELAYQSLIEHTLQPILYSLRYADQNSWEQIYRHQCINATLDPNGLTDNDGEEGDKKSKKGNHDNKGKFFNIFSWYQAWSERTTNITYLTLSRNGVLSSSSGASSSYGLNVSKAIKQAKQAYQSIETKLQQGNGTYLLNTTKPTLVDVYLFAHLCEALCDVHLVLVLGEYPCIVAFFQQFYEEYFGTKKGIKSQGEGENDWITWNNNMNSVNQFNRIPMGGRVVSVGEDNKKKYQDALRMMQSLALHCHDLREALADVSLQRREEKEEAEALSTAAFTAASEKGSEGVVFTKRAAGWMFHRMRMEGNLYSGLNESSSSQKNKKKFGSTAGGQKKEDDGETNQEEDDDITKKNRAHMDKIRRDNKKNDELWMSTVFIGSILAFAVAAAKSSATASSAAASK